MAIRSFQLNTSNASLLPVEISGTIRLTIRGDQKPAGYLPEGMNEGSFDIAWLLYGQKIVKPEGFKLTASQVDYLLALNGNDAGKRGFLIDQNGTKRILAEADDGSVFCPVPCMSGDNPVLVLEQNGVFARIATVNINKPIPENLPNYLCHTWRGFAGGKYYTPFGADGGVKYPLFFPGDSAWVQIKGLVI